jgi:uncharacterized coiled-coil protein SlyX
MEQRRATRERERVRNRAERRVSELEERILAGETALQELAWKLGDPDAHRDPDRARSLAAEREGLQAQVAELYKEWERAAAELESVDDAGAAGRGEPR